MLHKSCSIYLPVSFIRNLTKDVSFKSFINEDECDTKARKIILNQGILKKRLKIAKKKLLEENFDSNCSSKSNVLISLLYKGIFVKKKRVLNSYRPKNNVFFQKKNCLSNIFRFTERDYTKSLFGREIPLFVHRR